MNRQHYFNDIEERLSYLALRLEVRAAQNILDLNLHSEAFYQQLLNLTFSWNLSNINIMTRNAQGIDLVDSTGKTLAQVTATATKQKLQHSLTRNLSNYSSYRFVFISICKSAEHLRSSAFENPHGLLFRPDKDIIDLPSLLQNINALPIDRFEAVHNLVSAELKLPHDLARVEGNLIALIRLLSRENLTPPKLKSPVIPYDVEKKIRHNRLQAATSLIDEHKLHYPRLDEIYTEFDRQGSNRSQSVLGKIRAQYHETIRIQDPDDRFFQVVTSVEKLAETSQPPLQIPEEELRQCVEILVVDAFIRCKIFEKPEGGYNNAIAG